MIAGISIKYCQPKAKHASLAYRLVTDEDC